MAASARRDLYLQVSGNVTGLSAAMKTGRSLVNEFGSASINVLDAVEKKFGEIGANATPGLKQVEQAYEATFRRIRQNAQAIVAAPSGQAAIQIVDAEATRQAADAADGKARAFRAVAEAATRADQAQNGQNAAVRAYAVAAATAAVEAEAVSRALREQAAILGQVEGQLENVTSAQRKQVAVSGQARAGFQQLSYQLGDISTQYASGTAISMIFAQQSSQVIQAIQLISGESKGLIGLLGGPWGIAFASALVVLTPFVGKLLEGGDAVKKSTDALKKDAAETTINQKAKEAFTRTIEGQIDAQRRLNEEMERGLVSQREINRQNLEASKRRVEDRQSDVGTASLNLLQAQQQLADAKKTSLSADPTMRQRQIDFAQSRVDEVKGLLQQQQEALRLAKQGVIDATIVIAKDTAGAATNAIEQINRKYEQMADAAIKAARGNKQLADGLEDLLTKNERLKARELDREQKRQSSATSSGGNNNQIGRTVTVAEATQIVAGIGGRVTSGVRSREKQEQLYADKLAGRHAGPVAKPGTSDHERGQAIDIAFAPGLTVAKIREAFAKDGVAIRQLLVERDQKVFHVAFGAKGSSAEAQQRASERATLRDTRETIAINKLADVSEFFDPSDRKAAAERAARDFGNDFRAVFGDEDLLGKAIAEGDANMRALVDQASEAAQTQANRPLSRYQAQLEEEVGDINQALEGVEANAFASLEDSFVGVISGTENVGDAFKRMSQSIIADIARIAIQRAILGSLKGGFFGGFLSGGFADGGKIEGFANGGIPSVDQGLIRGPGDGRSDSILALVGGTRPIRVSNGEAIVNERGVRKHWALIDAINKDRLPTFADGGLPGIVLPSITQAQRSLSAGSAAGAGGTVMVRLALSEDLHATIDNRAAGVAVQVVRASATQIMDGATAQTMAAFGRPSI